MHRFTSFTAGGGVVSELLKRKVTRGVMNMKVVP